MRLIPILLLSLLAAAPAAAVDPESGQSSVATAQPAPQWHLDEIAFLTRDSGRWVASNAAYQNENEPMEAYVIEWRPGYANSMTGRLFGVIDGKETEDFWQFRQYWHPGEGKAYLEQFGAGGAFGVGPMQPEDGRMKMAQTFYAPDGGVSVVGHLSHNPDAGTHVTDSFAIVDGEWRPNRTYTWKRQPVAESGG
jgi:hypothetical protein